MTNPDSGWRKTLEVHAADQREHGEGLLAFYGQHATGGLERIAIADAVCSALAELDRLTQSLEVAEGTAKALSDGQGPCTMDLTWAEAVKALQVENDRLTQALEVAKADATFWQARFEHLEGRMIPLDQDAPFVDLFGLAEVAGGYNDADLDAQVGAKFITERYALRTALATVNAPLEGRNED